MTPRRVLLRSDRAERARRALAASGPWPLARVVLALGALAAGAALVAWVVAVGPRGAGLPGLPALVGWLVLLLALAWGNAHMLSAALVLLALAVAIPIVALGPPPSTAAGVGTAFVAVLELARWSIQRRLAPPSEDLTETRRWLHLACVLGIGWLVGVGLVAVAAGRIDLAVWHTLVAAAAAVALVGVVAASASGRLSSSGGSAASSAGQRPPRGPR